jgi:hypothetical protein
MITKKINIKKIQDISKYYIYFMVNTIASLMLFYLYEGAYGVQELNKFSFYHIAGVYLALIIDFGISMYGQRYVAKRTSLGLGYSRFIYMEVAFRVPILIAVACASAIALSFFDDELSLLIYCIIYTISAPLAVNWFFLGTGRLWTIININIIKLLLAGAIVGYASVTKEIAIYSLSIINFAVAIYTMKMVWKSAGCKKKIETTSIKNSKILWVFLKKRIRYGASYLIDAASGFWPYLFIKLFLVNSEMMSQFFLADRLTRALQTLLQPLTIYLVSEYAVKNKLKKEIDNLKKYIPILIVVMAGGALIQMWIYHEYMVDLFTSNVEASWRIFLILLTNPLLSIVGAIVGVLFVFQQRKDNVFLLGQVIGFLVILAVPYALNFFINGELAVAVAIVLSKLAIALLYIFKGLLPFIKENSIRNSKLK